MMSGLEEIFFTYKDFEMSFSRYENHFYLSVYSQEDGKEQCFLIENEMIQWDYVWDMCKFTYLPKSNRLVRKILLPEDLKIYCAKRLKLIVFE